MDEIPPCPEWWPTMLWKLHFPTRRPGPSPGPINYPPAIDSIMASLTIHTLSYMLLDQVEAQKFRNLAEDNLSITTAGLSRYHAAGATSANRLQPDDSLGNTGGRTPPPRPEPHPEDSLGNTGGRTPPPRPEPHPEARY